MILQSGSETTLVAGRRIYGVRVAQIDSPRGARVTIVVDGRFEWTFDQPGWRPISVGSGDAGTYLWSAREVIGLPTEAGGEPTVEFAVDEDLLAVFRDAEGWVLACETSVRRRVGQRETSRLELDAVIESLFWADVDVLVLRDDGGSERRVTVRGRGLEA